MLAMVLLWSTYFSLTVKPLGCSKCMKYPWRKADSELWFELATTFLQQRAFLFLNIFLPSRKPTHQKESPFPHLILIYLFIFTIYLEGYWQLLTNWSKSICSLTVNSLLGAEREGKKQECSFEWLKYIINLPAGKTSSPEEKHKEKSSWLKLETSFLERSEQSRELRTCSDSFELQEL